MKPSKFDRVVRVICDQMGIADSVCVPEATLYELGADSLDFVEIFMTLDDEFDVDLRDEHTNEVQTVQDVVDAVTAAENGKPFVKQKKDIGPSQTKQNQPNFELLKHESSPIEPTGASRAWEATKTIYYLRNKNNDAVVEIPEEAFLLIRDLERQVRDYERQAGP